MKLASSLLILLSTCALSVAQDAKPAAGGRPGRGARMDPGARAEKMKTDLGLSDEQTAKIKAVYEKNQAKNQDEMKKLRDDTTLSPEDRRKKVGAIFAATSEEINAILTPEQQTKWKEEQQKRRAEGARRGPRGGSAAKPEAKTNAKPEVKPEAKPEAK